MIATFRTAGATAALLSIFVVGACGGGSGTGAAAPMQLPQTAVVAPAFEGLAAPAGSPALTPTAARTIDATALLDWAETAYPDYFPGHAANIVWGPYTYRYYESGSTKNYLGVATDGYVYVQGTLVGGPLTLVDKLSNFACRIYPSDCTGAATGTTTTPAATTTVSLGATASTAALFCNYSASVNNAFLNMVSTVAIACSGTQRTITGNGIPDHTPGAFPSSANPHAIAAVNVRFTTTTAPAVNNVAGNAAKTATGYVNNGVKFHPSTNESYQNEGVWNVEALNQTYFSAGADSSNAHVQPSGAYHYHGIPEGYVALLGKGTGMALVGFAIDGFPIYARYGYTSPFDATGGTRAMTSSWRLKTTPGTGRPATSAVAMGTFTQDFEYVAGLGDLDECNGRFAATPEFPSGVYHYYATDAFPYVQRCVKGTAYQVQS